EVARVPVEALADGPRYDKPHAPPAWLAERRAFDPLSLPEPPDYGEALVRLMGAPTVSSKEWAYRQYDQQVGTNTLVLPGSDASRALEVPVVGGNVSFYNETSGQAILPTPIVGVVGVLEDAGRLATQWFKAPGQRIALLGPEAVSLGGSEYLSTLHGRLAGV